MKQLATITEAMAYFSRNPRATKWIPQNLKLKDTALLFEKKGEQIDKVVLHKNGLEQTGHFVEGRCTGVDEVSNIGDINTRFYETGIIETKVESVNGFKHSQTSHKSNYKGLAIPPQFSSDVIAVYGNKWFHTKDIKEAIRNPQSLNARILEIDSINVQ